MSRRRGIELTQTYRGYARHRGDDRSSWRSNQRDSLLEMVSGALVKIALRTELLNGSYRTALSYRRDDSITPLHFPDLSIEVASILE